jgi:hypothetical protein
MGDPVGAATQFLQEVLRFFETLAPGGFGLLLIPLIAFGVVTILVSRQG